MQANTQQTLFVTEDSRPNQTLEGILAQALESAEFSDLRADRSTKGPAPDGANHDRVGEARQLVETYRTAVESLSGPTAAQMYHEIARLESEVLGNQRAAEKAAVQALRQDPTSAVMQQLAFRLLAASGETDALAKLVGYAVGRIEESSRRAALLLDYALYLEIHQGQADAAAEAYERVLKEQPDSSEAIEGRARTLIKAGRWKELGELAQRFAERATDGEAGESRGAWWLIAALLADEHPVEDRVNWLSRALDAGIAPSLAVPLAVGLQRSAEEPAAAVATLQRQLERSGDAGATLHYEISWMLANQLDQPDEALLHARAAVDDDPNSPLYLSWLAELQQRHAKWEGLVETLSAKAQLAQDQAERSATLCTLAEVLECQINDPDRAAEVYAEALALDAGSLSCLQALGRLYAQAERWTELVDMHRHEAEVSGDPECRATALYRAAVILDEHLRRRSEAIAALEEGLAHAPTQGSIICFLERLYDKEERYADLVALHRKELQSCADDDRRIRLLERIGGLLDLRLGESVAAIDAYEQLLEHSPDNDEALSALARLYGGQGNHQQQLSTLRALAMRAASGKERAAILLSMARVLEESMRDPEQALAHAWESLDAAATAEGYGLTGRLLHRTGRWEDLIKLYRRQLDDLREPRARVEVLLRIARVNERDVGAVVAAAETYLEALQVDRGSRPALRGLLRLYGRASPDFRREVAAFALESGLVDAQVDASSVGLRLSLGLIGESPSSAERLVFRELERETPQPFAKRLAIELLTQDARWSDLAELLSGYEAALVTLGGALQPAKALELLGSTAAADDSLPVCRLRELLQTTLGTAAEAAVATADRMHSETDAEAISALRIRFAQQRLRCEGDGDKEEPGVSYGELAEQLLGEQGPVGDRALAAVEALARNAKDCQLLARVMHEREQRSNSDADTAFLAHLNAVQLAAAGAQDQAADKWRQALILFPECKPAFDSLKAHYLATADSDGLLWLFGDKDPSELDTAELLHRGELRGEKGQVEDALADFAEILSREPAHATALTTLERMLRAAGEHRRLAQVLHRAAQNVEQPAARADLLVRVALIYRDQLGDDELALELLKEAITVDADCVVGLLVAADQHLRMDEPTEAVSLLNRALLRTDRPEQLVAAHLALAHIAHRVLGDLKRARSSLRSALEVGGDRLEIWRHMAELAERAEDLEDLETCLARLAALEPEDEDQARALARLAQLLHQQKGAEDPDVLQCIERAHRLAPQLPVVYRPTIQHYTELERFEELERALARSLEAAEPGDRPELLLAKARVTAKHLGRVGEAVTLLRETLTLAPDDPEAVELLLDYLEEQGLNDAESRAEAIDLHRSRLANQPLLVDSIRRLGQICREEKRLDEAFCAEASLVWLGEASEEEIYFHRQQRRRASTMPAGALSGEDLRAIGLPNGDHTLRALFELVGNRLAELVPPDLSHYGISALEDARCPEDHPAWAVLNSCAELLGVTDFVLVEALGGALAGGACEPNDPLALVIPRDFMRYPVPLQRFVGGRLLCRAGLTTAALDPGRPEPLSLRDIEILCSALLRQQEEAFGEERVSAAILDDMLDRLRGCLHEDELKEAAALAKALWLDESEHARLPAWLQSCEVGALRAGVVCSGSLEAVSGYFDHAGILPGDDVKRELIGYMCSAEYATLRKRLA